jgi:replicative DNA helicase
VNIDQMPHSADSERAVLGSIMLDNFVLDQARRELPVEWFYLSSHKEIFRAMLSIHEDRGAINSVTVIEALRKTNSLESAGGALFVTNLTYGLPHVSNLKSYIKPIKETARRRGLIKLADRLNAQASDEQEDLDGVLVLAIEQLDRVRNYRTEKRKAQTLEEIADDQLLRYELFFKGVTDALPTGFRDVDDHLLGAGLVPSSLYVVAAPTSFGKTTLGLDIAANIAETGHRVYVVSREMSRESLFDRLVAVESDVARWKIRTGIYESDYKRVVDSVVRLSQRPIILDDVSTSLADVRGYLSEYERRDERVEMLVVDYLQLLEGSRKETRNQEVGSVSRGLKGLAMEYRIPVIAISQLSRNFANEKREPELRDLRDSGEIEQDADTVFFLFGDKPEEGAPFYDRDLKCAKQREGPLFRTKLAFDGQLVTYRTRPQLHIAGGVS